MVHSFDDENRMLKVGVVFIIAIIFINGMRSCLADKKNAPAPEMDG